jgi:2'-5' RNA ligase
VISIELLLDPESEARVRADWESLAAAGLSSLGAFRSVSNRPHVTLLVRPHLTDGDFSAVARRLPVRVAFDETLVFGHGDRGVFAWRVRLDDELRDVHRLVHESVPPGDDAPHTVPGSWTPHVTLARRLRLAALSDAVAAIGQPTAGSGVAVRRWDSDAKSVTPLTPDTTTVRELPGRCSHG